MTAGSWLEWPGTMTAQEYVQEISESDAQTRYPISQMIWSGQSQYCDSIIIADSATYGRMLFLDGELQSAEADERIYHECLVHPIMGRAPAGARVLVVGGGEGATVREVLRWNPAHVDWIDIDGQLVELCRQYLGWAPGVYADPRVHYQAADIRDALPHLGLYDVIILDLPDPDGDTGYLYSEQFWRDMRGHCTPMGEIVTHVGPVRPFGSLGAGAARVRRTMADADMILWDRGFYHICIPSFQGEWGFWIWSENGDYDIYNDMDTTPNAEVVTRGQLIAWGRPSPMWRRAIAATVPS